MMKLHLFRTALLSIFLLTTSTETISRAAAPASGDSAEWAGDPSAELRAWSEQTAERILKTADISGKSAEVEATTVMVTMRDGTRLATDIYRPIFPGSYPAILARTPYGKANLSSLASSLPLLGYVTVVQDVRGTFDSEGECRAFLDDGWGLDPTGTHWDGYDTVEWAAAQSWCDGKVGVFGASALGISANFAAGAEPPHLECAVVIVAAADMYHDAAHQGGGFRKSLVENWLADVGAVPDVLDTVIEHEAYDSLWQNASVTGRSMLIDVPTYHTGGWYDIFLHGTLTYFSSLQDNGLNPARGNQKVIIGPWTHSGQETTVQGQLTYPSNSVVFDAETDRMIDWFAYWLKGNPNGITDLPPVRYYLMGDVDDPMAPGNEWSEAADWPLDATSSHLYLAPGGLLRATVPGSAATVTYSYDPLDPVPTIGGANLSLPAGPYDQRPIESRDDVLVYTSDVLTEPLEITGRPRVILYASSSALDTDWIVRICDVYPDGRSMLVTDGIKRAKFRDGFETPELLTPGTVYPIEVALWPTAIVFNTGHRIRIDVMSANDPRFDPNPNTGDPLRQNTETLIADNSIHTGLGHPTRIILPVMSPADHPLFADGSTGVEHFRVY
jgi:predicted acyl esterase